MKKFLLKIITFAVVLSCVCAAIVFLDFYVVKNQYTGSYQASLLDKFARAEAIDSPKVILIGNSAVCFGMDSELLEEKIGMPVVDMGLHGGLSNAFHEEMARMLVSEGDIVILSHSDYADDDTISNLDLAWITIEKHYELWPLIREKDWPAMVKAYPKYAVNSLIHWISRTGNRYDSDSCYSRDAFNQYGDISFRPPDVYQFREGSIRVPEINEVCVDRINALNEYITSKGATLLVAGYPIAKCEFTPPASEYDAFEAELRQKLDCPVISHYRDYMIPKEYFYNEVLHLNADGAEIRTKQLIEDLSGWMEDRE